MAQASGVTMPPPIEILDSIELARRWNLPASWVRDKVSSRATNPIPHLKLGKYVRFEWGSPQLAKWLNEHKVSS